MDNSYIIDDEGKKHFLFKEKLDAYEMEDSLAAYACYIAGVTPEQAKAIGIH